MASRLLRWAALTLLALHLAVTLPGALNRIWEWTTAAFERAGKDRRTVESRMKGEAYFEAIEAIRRLLPRQAAYGLIAGGRETGEDHWVRYDLAPRRAVYLGKLRSLPGPARMARRIPPDLHYVVVANDAGLPPRIFEREGFLQALLQLRRDAR